MFGRFIFIVQGNKLILKRCGIFNNDEYDKIIEEENMSFLISREGDTQGLHTSIVELYYFEA